MSSLLKLIILVGRKNKYDKFKGQKSYKTKTKTKTMTMTMANTFTE